MTGDHGDFCRRLPGIAVNCRVAPAVRRAGVTPDSQNAEQRLSAVRQRTARGRTDAGQSILRGEGPLAAGAGRGHGARYLIILAERAHDGGERNPHADNAQQYNGTANSVDVVSAAQCIGNSALSWRHNDRPARGKRTRLNDDRRAIGVGRIGGDR